MKPLPLLAACAALALSAQTHALGSMASVTLVDRDSGAVLPTYYYRGEYWVAGNPGARYAIEIRNRAGGRLLAVTSVDGVNVLSGETAGWNQSGYVFEPGERYQITGWRKSNSEVAAFTFTASANSYAARTGRPDDVGVIGVALFRERAARYIPPRMTQAPAPAESRAQGLERDRPAAPPLSAQAAPQAKDPVAEEHSRQDLMGRAPGSLENYMTPLGTGHGDREYSYVQDTDFQRQQPEPNEVIRIRYDSLENLVALGIVRRPHPPWSSPSAFPGSQPREYVPDPPG